MTRSWIPLAVVACAMAFDATAAAAQQVPAAVANPERGGEYQQARRLG